MMIDVKETAAGPQLLINGVEVRSWWGTDHNKAAHALADALGKADGFSVGPCKVCAEKTEKIRDILRPFGLSNYDPVVAIKLLAAELTRLRETRLRILDLTRTRRLTRALRCADFHRIGAVDGSRILRSRIGVLRLIRVASRRLLLRMQIDSDGGCQKENRNKIGYFEA